MLTTASRKLPTPASQQLAAAHSRSKVPVNVTSYSALVLVMTHLHFIPVQR
jgi:hypothetical protein